MSSTELEYKTVSGCEYDCTYGFRIQYAIGALNREITEEEKHAFWKARAIIGDAMLKANTDAKPETHERAKQERAELLACFGGRSIYVEEIPNGYCNQGCCAFFPWFIVTTPVGRFKIGWRKRVIHLEWTDTICIRAANEIFPKEEAWPGYETTQYDKVIHAHSLVKAAEYIQRIFEAADKQCP